jgi:hypothetical protein
LIGNVFDSEAFSDGGAELFHGNGPSVPRQAADQLQNLVANLDLPLLGFFARVDRGDSLSTRSRLRDSNPVQVRVKLLKRCCCLRVRRRAHPDKGKNFETTMKRASRHMC